MEKPKTQRKAAKVYKAGGKPRVYTGHRVAPEIWAQVSVLAERKGITKVQLMNRLLNFSISREWVPEYIANPQLPGYTPPKELEVPPVFDPQEDI